MPSIARWIPPLWLSDLKTDEICNLFGAFEKTDMVEMLDKPEHIAFRVAERIEPTASFMRDDDNLTAAAKLDRAPCAFLDIDCEVRLFEHDRAAHFAA
ncbi:hypothetical protein ACFHWW_04320 [Ensifer sp. P24N7]